jgi:hypothetical protein
MVDGLVWVMCVEQGSADGQKLCRMKDEMWGSNDPESFASRTQPDWVTRNTNISVERSPFQFLPVLIIQSSPHQSNARECSIVSTNWWLD